MTLLFPPSLFLILGLSSVRTHTPTTPLTPLFHYLLEFTQLPLLPPDSLCRHIPVLFPRSRHLRPFHSLAALTTPIRTRHVLALLHKPPTYLRHSCTHLHSLPLPPAAAPPPPHAVISPAPRPFLSTLQLLPSNSDIHSPSHTHNPSHLHIVCLPRPILPNFPAHISSTQTLVQISTLIHTPRFIFTSSVHHYPTTHLPILSSSIMSVTTLNPRPSSPYTPALSSLHILRPLPTPTHLSTLSPHHTCPPPPPSSIP
ncbi:hypothetical protein JTE90_006693 [Oedothorax gibbosus]|uniref:Uncharacterized protein n=1 Tax=Oedothorax gibbosus TaxID=931172 RepID=A0AAV6TQC1_9ARAC|nr:hypothetical protein JTE90_006693 [Oedothorax gibbosus]